MDKAGLGVLVVSLTGLTAVARAGDPVPFFKADPKPVMYGRVPLYVPEAKPVMYGPVLPDPSAPECGIDDQACLDRHDARVLSLASSSHAREECAESTQPDRCYDAYDMMAGDFVPKPDPILSDPCAWVVLVDHQVATVSSKKLGITKRVLNRGWKARTFIGACNVSSVVPMQPAAVIPMPAWTVRKARPLPAAPAAIAPRAAVVMPVAVNATPPGNAPVRVAAAPATSAPSAPAASVPFAPAVTVQARPAPAAPPLIQVPPAPPAPPALAEPPASPVPPAPSAPAAAARPPAPPAPVAGPPGTTQPPPFARPAAITDAQGGPAPPSR